MVLVHNQCCADEFKQNPFKTLPQGQAVVPDRSSELLALHQVLAVVPDRSSALLPELGRGDAVWVGVIGFLGLGVSPTVRHTSSLGPSHSCLLSAAEVEVLGGMERRWRGSCSLGMRADPDKRISNDG